MMPVVQPSVRIWSRYAWPTCDTARYVPYEYRQAHLRFSTYKRLVSPAALQISSKPYHGRVVTCRAHQWRRLDDTTVMAQPASERYR